MGLPVVLLMASNIFVAHADQSALDGQTIQVEEIQEAHRAMTTFGSEPPSRQVSILHAIGRAGPDNVDDSAYMEVLGQALSGHEPAVIAAALTLVMRTSAFLTGSASPPVAPQVVAVWIQNGPEELAVEGAHFGARFFDAAEVVSDALFTRLNDPKTNERVSVHLLRVVPQFAPLKEAQIDTLGRIAQQGANRARLAALLALAQMKMAPAEATDWAFALMQQREFFADPHLLKHIGIEFPVEPRHHRDLLLLSERFDEEAKKPNRERSVEIYNEANQRRVLQETIDRTRKATGQ